MSANNFSDSKHSLAQDDTILHVDAAHATNKITKSQLRSLYERIAHGLRTSFNVGKTGPNKDVVTVISHGQILVPALFYGIIAAGGVYSAASPSSTPAELARQITTGKSNLLICGREHRAVALAAAAKCGLGRDRILVLESFPHHSLARLDGSGSAISRHRLPAQKITDRRELRESLIVILWSSGTTGLPKGVMLSHRNLVAETYLTSLSARQWAANEIAAGRTPEAVEYRTLGHLPISHIAGLWSYNIGPQYGGGCVYWMGKYKWADLLKYAREYRITAFYTVPSIYLRISKSSDVTDQFQWLVGAATGAAPMDGRLQVAANRKLAQGKEQMLGQTWGLSETTGAVTAVPKGESDETGSIGSVLPGVELRLVDEQMRDVERGQEGELLVRSELVTRGYFDNEKATREAFHEDWLCTGDIGIVKENGKIYVVDRKKVCSTFPPSRRGLAQGSTRPADFLFSLNRNFSNTKASKLLQQSSRLYSVDTHRSKRPPSLASLIRLPVICLGRMWFEIQGAKSQLRRSSSL